MKPFQVVSYLENHWAIMEHHGKNVGKTMQTNGRSWKITVKSWKIMETHWKIIGKPLEKTLEKHWKNIGKTLEKHWKKPSKPIIFVSQAARFILEKMRSRPRSAKHREAVTSAAGPTAEATGDG